MTLRDELAGPGGDVLGLMRLQGGGFAGQGRHRALMDLQIDLQSPVGLENRLRALREAGWRAMVAYGEARLLTSLRRAPAEGLPRPLPVVPNLQGFMREAVEHGMVGAGMRRVRRVGPPAIAGLMLRGIGRMPALVFRRDFPTILRCFVELELADFRRLDPPVVFLQAQMTDLALALNNPRIVEAFIQAVQRRTGAAAGLISLNPGRLAEALNRWGLAAGAFVVSLDRPGVERLVSGCAGPVWGIRDRWLDGPTDAERRRQQAAPLTGWMREDAPAWQTAGDPVGPAAAPGGLG
jgi:hypothetical protein